MVFKMSAPSPPHISGRASITTPARPSRPERLGPLCEQVPDRFRYCGQVVAQRRADPDVRIGALALTAPTGCLIDVKSRQSRSQGPSRPYCLSLRGVLPRLHIGFEPRAEESVRH